MEFQTIDDFLLCDDSGCAQAFHKFSVFLEVLMLSVQDLSPDLSLLILNVLVVGGLWAFCAKASAKILVSVSF